MKVQMEHFVYLCFINLNTSSKDVNILSVRFFYSFFILFPIIYFLKIGIDIKTSYLEKSREICTWNAIFFA